MNLSSLFRWCGGFIIIIVNIPYIHGLSLPFPYKARLQLQKANFSSTQVYYIIILLFIKNRPIWNDIDFESFSHHYCTNCPLWIPIFIQPCFFDWPSIPFDLWSVLSPKKQHFLLLFRFNDGKLNFLISESHSFLVADESPKTHFVFYFDLSSQVLQRTEKNFAFCLLACLLRVLVCAH